ncbi:LuxR C-terminal-related transcriptional regulator [Williamsia phyllosphaerae]|uniref:Helix-turn-helix transcriptional regulator n=1 Tax=Williamsia phyllosphaerae TaxID=885042 RepID=A0ABQ1UC41_9NOCA|nr:LuxR C-terminal-related transcriptional regulator [Williamsia phyllosphaerae]GGF12667.1 helix-turn-helix transcriptional regulator [Williamsia phyllosphaerae]
MATDLSSPTGALAGMPDAQSLLLDVESSAGRPLCAFVVGVAGSGKSAVLTALSDVLRRLGVSVAHDVPVDPEPGCAVLVDDVQDRDDATLAHLATLAVRTDLTVVVAGEPRDHREAIADLSAALRSRGRMVLLRPISAAGVVERSGRHLLAGPAAAIARATGGNRAAVDAALHAVEIQGQGTDGRTLDTVAATAISAWQHRQLRRLDRDALAVLTIAAAGSSPDPDTVAQTAAVSRTGAVDAIDRARGSGFLGDSDHFLPGADASLVAVVGAHQIGSTRAELVRVLIANRSLDADRAIAAADEGMVDPALAQALCDFARAAAGHRAVTLWSAARTAGADPATTDVALAQAALEADDLDVASRIADAALASESTDTVRTGVRIAAAVASRRGTYTRAAQLFRWLGPDRAGADAAIGAIALIASGDREGAAAFAEASHSAPPTADNASSGLLADGLAASLGADPAPALGPVLRSMSLRRVSVVEPESAAALAVLLNLHGGDLGGAQAVLNRVHETGQGYVVRLDLLRAWTAMMAGDLADATAVATATTARSHRDLLLRHALAVGIARRRGDSGALSNAWRDAQAVVAEAEVDLFALLPLGELWLAAIRCGDVARVAHLAADAGRLLTDLGDPPVWSAAWHWYGVQAAILSDDPATLVPHARALGDASEASSYAAVLAQAGRVWLKVLQGDDAPTPVVAADIDVAARSLQRVGHAFDGARLAAEGALRIGDTRSATALLQTARTIGPTATTAPVGAGDVGTQSALSDREAEVAEQLVLGLTYREIGAALYISAKTVEHHVARIRRRLGVGSRSELMSALRAAGYGSGAS